MSNATRFLDVYTRRLAEAIQERPADYGYPASDAPAVAARMVAALARGSANKEGKAIRGACRELGIPYTYAGIRAFLAEGVTP